MLRPLKVFCNAVIFIAFSLVFINRPLAVSEGEKPRRLVCCDEAKPVYGRFDEAKQLEITDPEKAVAIYESIIRDFPNWADGESPTTYLFSDRARSRIEVLRCLKLRGRDHFAQSRQALLSEIRTAIAQKNQKTLEEIASCDFEVAFADSDVIWPTTPVHISKALIRFQSDFLWDKALFVDAYHPDAIVVPLRDSPDFGAFWIRKTSDGYSWSGYSTQRDELLKDIPTTTAP